MKKMKEKKETLFLKILSLIFLFFLIISIFPLIKNFSKQRAINSELEELKTEIAQFEKNNLDLQTLMDYLQSEEALQEQARVNLNLKKADEEVIVIEPFMAQDDVIEFEEKESNNRQRWFNYFFGA
jgi:cell division protein FtsL